MKAFIFDLDGVLVSTDCLHYQAWKKLADELSIPFDERINHRLRGVSRMASLEIILENSTKNFSEEEKKELAEKKNATYVRLLSQMSKEDVSDEVRDTLKKLKEKGYLLGIASSSRNAKTILKQVELLDEFDAISDGTNIQESKPNPEVFLKAAEMLKVSPKECFGVDDAVAGIDAANAAGMKSIGYGDSTSYEKCDYTISDFKELETCIM